MAYANAEKAYRQRKIRFSFLEDTLVDLMLKVEDPKAKCDISSRLEELREIERERQRPSINLT